MIHCLYKTTNVLNGRFYIGVHSTDDLGFGTETYIDQYCGSGDRLERSVKKYGRHNFLTEVIAYFDNVESAYKAEEYIVTKEWLSLQGRKVYNDTPGGKIPPRVTRWYNDGKRNIRLRDNQNVPVGFVKGRILKNDETRIESVKKMLSVRNSENNPMSNLISKLKMTNVIREQYANGRVPHNKVIK